MPTTINPSDQTITQYNIQTGGANNLLNNVAPSATSGNPLCSAGSSSQPIFSATPTVTSMTISGTPSAGTDATNVTYVTNAIAAVNPATSVLAATTGAFTVTYLNGVAGVGATLTNAGAQAAFSIDGVSPIVGQRVLIKNQGSTFQNGVYTVTIVGTGASNWVLTRALDYDQPSDINNTGVINVLSGTANALTGWLINVTVVNMGADPITYVQYNNAPITVTQYDVLVGGASNAISSVGPGNAGQVFQSGGNAANPAYSTSTYPTTNAINTLLYASSANVMSALATANNGVLITSSGGIPSISSTLPSAVQGNITSTGTITSGTWTGTTIAIANGGTNATSFTQSNGITTYNGTQLVNYAGPQLSSGGVYTNTSQPLFYAYSSVQQNGVTGDGTLYKILFDSTSFNVGSGWSTSTSFFTAPVTGTYLFTWATSAKAFVSANTNGFVEVNCDGKTFYFFEANWFAMAGSANNQLRLTGSVIAQMTATHQMDLLVQVSGNATKNVNLTSSGVNSPDTWLMGYLLC